MGSKPPAPSQKEGASGTAGTFPGKADGKFREQGRIEEFGKIRKADGERLGSGRLSQQGAQEKHSGT